MAATRRYFHTCGTYPLLCAILTLGLLLCCAPASQAALSQSTPQRHVLALHAYHQGYQWTDTIQTGVAMTLARLAPEAMVHVEYMDTKRQPPEKSFDLLAEFYAKKYAGFRPDVILASDDNALDFLLAYRDRLWPGSPVVFCGVNDYREGRLRGQRGFTGVSERADIRGTIEAALKLMPSMRRLVIITDSTETGQYNRTNSLAATQEFLGRFEVQEIAGRPFGEVASTLSTLSPDTAILHMGLFRDPDGQSMSVAEFMAFTRKGTPQPIFGVWDFLLGHGAVGGVVVSGEHQGQAMAELAARILAGENVDDIPPVTQSPNKPMFDYREIVRQGFSLENLPKNSLIVYQPQGLWDIYRPWLLLLGSLFTVMAATIGLLWINILRRRRAEAQRRTSERRSREFMDALSLAVVELDLDGRIVFANPGSYVLSGAPAGSLPGRSILDLAATDEARQAIAGVLAAAAAGLRQPGSVVARLDRFDGGQAELKVDWLCLRDTEGQVTGFLAAATDLTDLRRTEREREAQHRFTTDLMNANPTPIYAKDKEGRYVRVNRAFCEFVGLMEAEMLGRRISDLKDSEFAGRIADLDERLFAHGGQQVFEAQTANSQGQLRDLLFMRSLYFDAQGKPEGIVGTMTDITARKRTEADLRESREKYRVMLESVPLALAVTDTEGCFLEINRAAEALFGSQREKLLHLLPLEREFTVNHLDGTPLGAGEYPSVRAVRQQQIIREENQIHRADGSVRIVQVTAAPLPLHGYGAMLAIMDITERKRLEQVIQSRLSAVTSPPGEVPDLSFTDLFDLGDIQAVQDAFAQAVGVASLITAPDGTPLTRPSNPSGLCLLLQNSINGSKACEAATQDLIGLEAQPGPHICPSSGLYTGVAPIRDGNRDADHPEGHILAHWFICQARPEGADLVKMAESAKDLGLDPAEYRKHLEVVPVMSRRRFEEVNTALNRIAEQFSELARRNMQQARYIGERARVEEALSKAKEDAEAGSLAKSEFMTNVSHEIRTPLHGVLGMLQLLQTTPLGEDQSEYVDKAIYSARALLSVINDILDFSKIESGTLELSLETFDPAQLVRACAAVFDDQARRKELALSVHLSPGLPGRLLGDPGKIRQILFNLLGNAVKFTDQGEVAIEVDSLPQADGKCVLLLTVADTGVGIPEERQGDVFDPFTQAEPAFTKRFAGTGLGLAIVRKLTALMDGGITLESASQKGTSISLALRLEQAEHADGPGLRKKLPILRPLKLLLAEDNPISQLAVKSFLQRAGHEVHTAVNGLEALKLLEATKYDAVLMDIQMPEMDGMAATKAIREHDGTLFDPGIPIIALTAYAQLRERKAFLEAGMNAAIAKPLELTDILEALAQVLNSKA
ncbi:MAG: ABC transporter substrate binding protein [Humidesulfovibrio sp.]|uniref:ABC transporter substrate binding protein n=1 Tax=Humidesulfovibrio sp. TaxID=2910988 RepID=UPI0027F4BE9F|nr:ABC transporter substrate binding protein [Humidesulfovibrio sp.]MDQ7836519.1 ABC transporter substrate binding protein [Humidesulfovibrio sp.]